MHLQENTDNTFTTKNLYIGALSPPAWMRVFNRAFRWAPPAFHCLCTSADTSNLPLEGLWVQSRRSVASKAAGVFSASRAEHNLGAMNLLIYIIIGGLLIYAHACLSILERLGHILNHIPSYEIPLPSHQIQMQAHPVPKWV